MPPLFPKTTAFLINTLVFIFLNANNVSILPVVSTVDVSTQWGTVSQYVSQETEISFPINFKTNCYFIIGNDILVFNIFLYQ